MADKFRNVREGCREFACVLDKLLTRRRQEIREGGLPRTAWLNEYGYRTWTQEECDLVGYTSYPDLRKGKIAKPPSREKVMEIANYLECTLEERNRLLLAADHPPVQPYLTGETLAPVLQIAQSISEYLPLPSYVINRDWSILFFNNYLFLLFGLCPSDIANIPQEHRSILHFIFDERLPIHNRLKINNDLWDQVARRNIYGFKTDNLLCQNESWYKEYVARIRQIPLLDKYWDEVDTDTSLGNDQESKTSFLFYTTELIAAHNKIIRFRSLLTSLGNYDYPQIVSYVPADEESIRGFEELGIPTPESCWNRR